MHRAGFGSSTERFFAEPEDRALADISDLQGVGGKHGLGRAPVRSGAAPPRPHDDSPS
jgi:hypothetical protein